MPFMQVIKAILIQMEQAVWEHAAIEKEKKNQFYHKLVSISSLY